MSLLRTVFGLFLATALLCHSALAQSSEKRIALVIGNGAYQDSPLATPANDAGLIAQTLQAAGFDVVGARDLDMATLRSSMREFLDKASASGPDTVALVYYAGHGLQFEGENYLVPIDAHIARDADVPLAAVRVSDLVKPLATLPLKARIVVLDAARANAFARSGQPLAGGLALMQPDPGALIAFNAAPGTIGPEGKDYSAYATALSEMIKEGGLPLDELFERVRLRTSELTGGAEVAWHASKVQTPFLFFERTNAAPQQQTRFMELRDKPIRDFDARDAYLAALTRDTMRGYEDFLNAYPNDPLAKRARAILATRREAIVWRESAIADTPDAYWSYLRRYPRGPHAGDARRRLAHFAAAFEPPATFTALAYDIPPPPPDEIVYLERPAVYFADPIYALPPQPPVPIFFLPPRPVYFVDLAPPPPPVVAFALPIPVYYPVPAWVERPAYVVAPPINVVSVNIHNTVVVNQTSQTVAVTDPQGRPVAPLPVAAPTVPSTQSAQPGASSAAQQLIQAHPVASAAIAAAAVALPAAAALRAKQQQAHGSSAGAPTLPQLAPVASPPAVANQPRPGQPAQPAQPPAVRPVPPQSPASQSPSVGASSQPAPTVPAGARPLPVPTARPAAPNGSAPIPSLVAPQTAQPNRPQAPEPRAQQPQVPAHGAPVAVAPHAPQPINALPTRSSTGSPQRAVPQRVSPTDSARQAAAQQAARQRAQQMAVQAQQRASQQAQIQQQQRAAQAQQQRAALQNQIQQQRAAQAAQQRAAMQAQMQQRAMQAHQRAAQVQQIARQKAGQSQRRPHCEPGHSQCR